jgi:hypothetical protein
MPPVTDIEIIVKHDAPLPISAYQLARTWKKVAQTTFYDIYRAITIDEPPADSFEPVMRDMQSGTVIDFDHATHYVKEVLTV